MILTKKDHLGQTNIQILLSTLYRVLSHWDNAWFSILTNGSQSFKLTVDASSSPIKRPSLILMAPIISWSIMCGGIYMPGGPPMAICC